MEGLSEELMSFLLSLEHSSDLRKKVNLFKGSFFLEGFYLENVMFEMNIKMI